MANEITASVALSCFKSTIMAATVGRSKVATTFSMTANVYSAGTVSVGTSVEAIPLGEVTTPHWAFFLNLDATNYLTLRNGSSGADLIRLYPGEFCVVPLDIAAVPYALADTAACLLEYLIFGR